MMKVMNWMKINDNSSFKQLFDKFADPVCQMDFEKSIDIIS